MPATAGINPAEDDSNKLSDDIRYTPKWLRVSAGWGWRLLVVVAVVFLFWQLGSLLSQLTVPLLLAVLLTSGLQQMTNWLTNHRLPRWLAAVASLLVLVLVLVGLLGLVGAQIATQ